MKTILLGLGLVAVIAVGIAHWWFGDRGRFTTEPEFTGLARTVSGQELLSTFDPAVLMRFDPDFRYLGGQKFVLYGVADTEQHFFAEIDGQDRLRSLYWVQFEAYLPDKDYRYDYEDSPLRERLGEFDFYVDTAVVESNPAKRRRGTDGWMARQLVASKGYEFPQDFSYSRWVHLPDPEHRKELMVIFIEDLAPLGLTAAGLEDGGAQAGRWPEVEHAHLDKVQRTLVLEAAPGGMLGNP